MKIDGRHFRTIRLADDGTRVEVIDQTRLPFEFALVTLDSSEAAAQAIERMVVRGAPLIGATAAYGMALATREDPSDDGLERARTRLMRTRAIAGQSHRPMLMYAMPFIQDTNISANALSFLRLS